MHCGQRSWLSLTSTKISNVREKISAETERKIRPKESELLTAIEERIL
jgi:hypothetical protein